MEANALSAGLVALSLEREVNDKQRDLEAVAASTGLVKLVAAAAASDWAAGPAVDALSAELQAITPRTAGESSRTPGATDAALADATDLSWFLQDATGVTRWRRPFDGQVVDENFVWRDYFHGLAGDLPRETRARRGPADRTDARFVSLPIHQHR